MDPALWELLRTEEEGADGDREIEAVIRLARPGIEIPGARIVSRFGTIATCRIPAPDVIAVRARRDVISLKAARLLSPGFEPPSALPDVASPAVPGECATDVRRSPELGPTGAGVVVAAVDWGVDVDSAAFRWPDDPVAARPGRDPGGTRFLSFWDQRDEAVGPRPDPYGYGTVHSKEEINRALQDSRPYERLGYHPAIADRRGRGTHGTRTVDIAAGNGQGGGPVGIAPDADLIFVHLADRNTGGVANFGDSVRLLEAVDFISRTAGPQPCVINISAGRICGPKDGTALVERAFDELLAATPGRFVVNSAGNYFGWRTHSCGTIAPGEVQSLTFAVGPSDVTVNELEIWYDGADEFAVRIDPPGYRGGRPVCLGERSDLLIGSRVVGHIYHRKCDPNNGDNHIVAYLDPINCAGIWTVTLEARRVSSGRFHAWIERDDSCPGCQARFTHDDSNPATTIGSIASSHLPLIVGAYDGHDPARPVATFSSAGPCRDGRGKPDLVAPGVAVLAARSAPIGTSRNPGLLVRGNGTSFAAPHVTGAVALCFETAGNRLSAHEIRSLVLGSCDPVPDADPQCRLGHGYLNIPRLIADTQQALAVPAAAPDAKEPTMDNGDSVVPLGVAPAVAYREYLYRPDGQLARWIGARFDVVARPGQRVDRALQPGDLLIEVVLGRMRGGRCVILEEPELEVMASRPRLPQGQLILRPLPRVEMSEPMSVEPVSEAEDAGLDRLIGQGLSENQITDTLYYARHPGQSGATLHADTRAAREWQSIRDTEVRPAARQRLVLSPVDPVQLAVFFSQYENDSRVPPEDTRRFLTGTPLLSMGRTLRDRVIGNWRNGGRPLTALGLYELAVETAGDPATAQLLCHNVTKAFVHEGAAITWHGSGTEGEYTDGQRTYTAKVINSAGRLRYFHSGKRREVISVFYLLFAAKEFGTDDPGDWYHYFVTAAMTALASGGTLSPTTGRGRREDVEGDEEGREGRVGTVMYRGLVSDRVADLEKQMTDPALASVPGYRGWVLANVLSFLEGGHYGADYATDQSDVVRESRVHLRGAAFGLRTIGGSPGKTWRWYLPTAGSLSDADLAVGFNFRDKTAAVWGPNAKPAAGEAAGEDDTVQRVKIPDSGHAPADVITEEGSPFLTPEFLDARDTEAMDVAAWMEDENAEQEVESPFLISEFLDAQDTEATDVAAWMENEKAEQEAEVWQAGTTVETGWAGQGPGVGQVTVGVAELLQLGDTAAALDQLTRSMVRQTHLQRGGLVEPTRTPALPEWELEGEDTVPMTLPAPRPDPMQEQCRQRWDKIHDRLPEAVQTALGQGNYALAIGLAIHSGIRDANLLTNMVFFTWQGPRRGYCRLASTEKDYIFIWNDIMKTMVRPRLAVPSPPVPQAGGIICVARKDRRLAGPAPDNPAVDLTGRYEHRTPAGIAPAFTFRLNQAGKHVEAVLTTVLLPKGKAGRRDSYRLHGDLQTDGSFLMFSRTQPDMRALLRRDAQTGSVSLDTSAVPGGKIDQLDLVATTPTLMESTLNYLPASFALVKPHEWFPLTRIQTRHLIDSLAPAKIDPFLEQYFDTPAGDRVDEKIALRKAARPFDDYLKNVFDDEKVGIHYLDRPLARFYARTLLSESRWKRNLTRSHLDWIQIMLSMVARGDYSKDFQGIQAHLGLRPDAGPTDPNTAQHTYKVTLKLTGVGFFAHGYKGSITFEKTNPPLWPTSAAWPQGKVTFGIWILGLSVAPDISVGDTIEGEATTSLPWQPPDIPGTVSMVQGGIGVPGVGANAGFLHVYGSEIYPPMAVLFSGVGFKIPTSVPKSRRDLIPLPDLGGSWGKVQARSLPDLDYTTSHIKTDHAVTSGLTEDVHFCSDGALLTEDARQALRIMCANELAALMSPTSRLAINGHTDREDTKERNLALSDMRARNTYQAIKDILGDKLAIPSAPPHTELSGKGETEAERDGRPDNERNPKYRRTDIILNGRLVLTLRAQ